MSRIRRLAVAAGIASVCLAPSLVAMSAQAAPPQKFGNDTANDRARAKSLGDPILSKALSARGNRGSTHGFADESVTIDARHMAHIRARQTVDGVPVWGAESVAHLNPDGSESSVTDNFLDNVTLAGSSTATVTAVMATSRAKATTKRANAAAAKSPDLWVFRHGKADSLAWRVQLNDTANATSPSMPVVFVDAHNGATLWSYDNLETSTGNSNYSGQVALSTTLSGTTYQLKDGTRGNQQVSTMNHGTSGSGTLLTDTDDIWGDGTNAATTAGQQTAGVDAAFAAAETWDFYKTTFGRNGIWNTGAGAPSKVHYGNSYVNAYWDGSSMTYGDGTNNAAPLTSLDVGGHEMTHGVTENTANLTYSGESGGLNEATSDILGTAVEWFANNPVDRPDYLIGEMINVNGDGSPLRYMDQPSKDGGSRDCWSSGIGSLDVHYSSGPANHFFYLLSEGSGAKTINGVNYNSPTCNNSVVTGIGITKAEQVWYRALTTYFTASTNYAGARSGTLNATADLYGNGSAEYLAVCNAWAAVSVGTTCAPAGVVTLTNGVAVTGLSGTSGTNRTYSLTVPSGATNLTFALSGGTGNANLYTKFGSAPTTSAFDCGPQLPDNNETCTVAAPAAGTYYALVNAAAEYTGAQIVGSYTVPGPTTTVLQNNVAVTGLSGAAGSSQYFSLAVPSGASNLSFSISGGSGDADLYVKFGATPTTTSYDCRPYISGNSETCSFATPQVGTYYLMVRGYAAYSGVSLVGKYSAAGGGGTVLQNNVPVTGLSGVTGSSQSFTMAVPSGAAGLSFTTSGGSGDADLYVKFGSAPTTTSYDCRPYISGNSETCSFATPQVGTYYVMVRAYATYSGVSLVGKYSTGSGGNVLQNNVPVTSLSGTSGTSQTFTLAVPSGATGLSFTISGGTGDADLYVRFGAAPTTTTYDCRPYLTGNSETCTFATPQVGTYYVMIRAYATYSGVTLVGKYS